jgi:hypothetical protein
VPPSRRPETTTLGWREWIALPDWGIEHLKAKIDTGARTSSLHAFGLEWFDRGGNPWVRFEIHPLQRSVASSTVAEAAVIATRDVKSSSGDIEHRPVVHTTLVIAGRPVVAELTLTRRDEMGFRMLVGREALRNRFVVDPGVSYLGGRPDKSIRRRHRLTDAETTNADRSADATHTEPTPSRPTPRKKTPVKKSPVKKSPVKKAASRRTESAPAPSPIARKGAS